MCEIKFYEFKKKKKMCDEEVFILNTIGELEEHDKLIVVDEKGLLLDKYRYHQGVYRTYVSLIYGGASLSEFIQFMQNDFIPRLSQKCKTYQNVLCQTYIIKNFNTYDSISNKNKIIYDNAILLYDALTNADYGCQTLIETTYAHRKDGEVELLQNVINSLTIIKLKLFQCLNRYKSFQKTKPNKKSSKKIDNC